MAHTDGVDVSREGGRSRSTLVPHLPAVIALTAAALIAAMMGAPAPTVAATGTLQWAPCTDSLLADFQCTQMHVPMDRREPTGPQFTLLAGRHASTGSATERIGTLVFIPGGPGDSGVSMLPGLWYVLPEELKRRFDLVTWDPRGAGGTTPALRPCAYPRDGANPYRTGAVNWRSWGNEARAQASEFEAACQVENAAIIAHLGTNENASDLDALRAALGEDRLSFWAVSFGTRIGAVYALTFPDRVRAMLLDGPMDPTSGWMPAEYYSPAGVKGFQWVARYFPTAGRQF
jgi:pimeloyl-ACP methyl ester carboxylesterase